MHDLSQRKDPQTDSEKLTNTIAYAAPDGNLRLIGEDHPTRDRGYREPDPNHGTGLAHGSIAYNRIANLLDAPGKAALLMFQIQHT